MLLVLTEREQGSVEMCAIFKSTHPLGESARWEAEAGATGCYRDGVNAHPSSWQQPD